jgi:hypothetical protein
MSRAVQKIEIVSEVSCLPVIERKPGSDHASRDWVKSPNNQHASVSKQGPPSNYSLSKDHPYPTASPTGCSRPPTLPNGGGKEYERGELDAAVKRSKKGILKVFESRFLTLSNPHEAFNSGHKELSSAGNSPNSSSRHRGVDTNARRLLKEAFKLCGLANYEPTKAQIDRFVALNDVDGDGIVGSRDLEDRMEHLQDEEYNSFTSRSNLGSGFSSAINMTSSSPRNSEKELLKKAARDKLGESGFELLTGQCKKVFLEFDPHDTGYIEYES